MRSTRSLRRNWLRWGRSGARWPTRLGAVLIVALGAKAMGQEAPGRGHRAEAGGITAVLAQCSPTWSTGGLIRRERLQELAADPRIRGDQAIALATLIHHFGKETPDSFRADEFDALPDRKHIEGTYRAMAAKAAEIRPTLFADGRPHFDRLRQGPVGDCYFLSGVGWMAHYHPDRIAQAIRPRRDGGFEVTFPSGERASVAPLTETEILVNSAKGTLADGLWVAALEKALGVIEGEHSRRRASIADPILRISGGSSRENIRLWTGHPVETLHLNHPDEARRVAQALRLMQEHRLMAEASIGRSHAPPSALPHGHSYAVMAFDPARSILTLWNPWGDDFTPKGAPGPEHGWPRRHGLFEIPLHDFLRTFSSISIERRP